MSSKIGKLATLITALGIILSAVYYLAGKEFAKTSDIDAVNERCNSIVIDQTRTIQKLDDIGTDVKEIKVYILKHR